MFTVSEAYSGNFANAKVDWPFLALVRTAFVIDRYREPSGEPPGQGAPAQARAAGEEQP